ncbi:MAG TPA: hypothetical protein VN033_10860 [Vulgatibacter sp.]|nr:hypothetical protein [Vulgatibacter sp.]
MEGARTRIDEAGQAKASQLPVLRWEPCGAGCESASLALPDGLKAYYATLGTEAGPDGKPEAFVSMTQGVRVERSRGESWKMRRIVGLGGGQTVGAVRWRYRPASEKESVSVGGAYSAFDFIAGESFGGVELSVDIGFDARQRSWDFKGSMGPIATYRGWCLPPDAIGSSPPSRIEVCPLRDQVEVVQERGKSDILAIPTQGAVALGADNGVAVWSELLADEPARSRLRAWTPGSTDARTVGLVDGNVCALGPGADRIVGFRGTSGVGCDDFLADRRFFWMPLSGGEVVDGPVIGEPMVFGRVSTWGDYAAANAGRPWEFEPSSQRSSVVLVRLSDWKMRIFYKPTNRVFSYEGPLVDDRFLYFLHRLAEDDDMQSNDRIYRYSLDRFDEIGMPFE